MMRKALSILTLSLALCGGARAIVVQTITLKDGSVFKGYIESIPFSDNTIGFNSDEALVKNATIESQSTYTWDNLPADWKQHLEQAPDFSEASKSGKWTIGSARLGNRTHTSVLILESGIVATYQEIGPSQYTLHWNDIQSISVPRREHTALTGINRSYITEKGTLEGQYAGETDSTLSIYDASGMKSTFKKREVKRCEYKALNPDQPLIEQAELLDVVVKKDNDQLEGIIVEQNYAQARSRDNYFIVQKADGSRVNVLVRDIASVKRRENSAFRPLTDIKLSEGEMVINRQKAGAAVTVTLDSEDRLLLSSVDGAIDVTPAEGKVTVEYYDATASDSQVYQLTKVKVGEKVGTRRNAPTVNYFTYRDLANSISYQPTRFKTSVNKTAKVVFTVSEPGVYALYDMQRNSAVLFQIKK